MEIIRCEKGHFYDADLNSSCPQCAAEAQGAGVSGFGATEPIGATEPVGQAGGFGPNAVPMSTAPIGPTEPVGQGGGFGSIGPTEPVGPMSPPSSSMGATIPVTNPGFGPTDFTPGGGGRTNMHVQAYEPTTPVPQAGIAGFNPVVGWLVCVDGADKGTDYRIRNGNNYIGRDQSMDICIRNDTHVSNQNAAVIGYDDVEHQFFFGPAGGHNTVRVNGKMVINAVPLEPYDELTVGTSKLMFVPLCGERFDWNAK